MAKSYRVTELELAGALELLLDMAKEHDEGTGVYDARYRAAELILVAWHGERRTSPPDDSSAAPS
jgi:hypothetical protein